MYKAAARKIAFLTCILLSVVLFAEGFVIIADLKNISKSSEPNTGYSYTRLGENKDILPPQNKEPVNVLILGLDEEEMRSDVIILANFSPEENRLNLLSIARDTRVRVKNRTSKINALIKLGGERLVAEKIKEITSLDVHYYIILNFEGFRRIIDTLDGVEIEVPFEMDYEDPDQDLYIHLKKGLQVLNGEKAEQFVRYRKGNKRGEGYEDGDIGRIKMQQEFMKALIEQKLKFKYISKADEIYLILKKYLKTNIEIRDINRYIRNIQNVKIDEVRSFTLPGESAYAGGVWYFIHDLKKTRALISKNFYKE